ncbi:sensor domain-containing protein [Novosphingobium naphthalenivorans]|uniref:sensor domain-containing protein n=1 Tax=Novosphingobium naphthalenivorans TaxID=273168 RepID=UPI00083583B3|nr:EAL domain-containing protein [Novosphingobium naphthalenivorans]
MNVTNITDLQAIINVMPLPVFVKNQAHRIVLLNDEACTFFGHSRDVMLGFSDFDLFPEEEVRVFHAEDDRVFSAGEDSENEEQVTDSSGNARTVITRKRRVFLGDEPYLVGIISDVTAYREAEAHNRYLAFHDTLTGLPNRALLSERIDQVLLRRHRSDDPCSLLYIDLDRFKEVNDTYGHQAGDTLLQGFATRLTALVRASDTVCRLGGDEFAVLLPDSGNGTEIQQVCQRILDAAAEPFAIGSAQAFISASIGIAGAEEGLSTIEMQRRADVALYQAKREGRACYRHFTNTLDEKIRRHRRLELDLRESLATQTGLEVHYQPLIQTAGDTLAAMEALVRWRHPEFGLLEAEDFIGVAEESGLIIQLGDWVLEQACEKMAHWAGVTLAVNLSPAQIRADDCVRKITDVLERTGFPAANLELEVTEGAILDTDTAIRERIKALRAMGIRIVLDDFGTGYSSLAHLQRLDVDKVKIDKSFVRDLCHGGEAQAIVHAVTALARVLSIPVTAEGVETNEQSRALRAIGCDELQGFLFSRALSPEDTERYLAERWAMTRAA